MAHPLLNTVTSSTVEAYLNVKIGDEAAGDSSLFVEFKSGKIYRYQIPTAVCDGLDAATSKGQYINQVKKMHPNAHTLMTADDVTTMIQSSASASGPKKTKKAKAKMGKKALLDFFAMYPELSYFF